MQPPKVEFSRVRVLASVPSIFWKNVPFFYLYSEYFLSFKFLYNFLSSIDFCHILKSNLSVTEVTNLEFISNGATEK
jgi:hypothetical protein